MSGDKRFLYWDSDVFLSYFEGNPDRLPNIRTILGEVERDPNALIVTSSLTIVEVAYLASERSSKQLDSKTLRAIDNFWRNHFIIRIVELNEEIARRARNLVRLAAEKKWNDDQNWRKLKPPDAIHLATAAWAGVEILHTYNLRDFEQYAPLVGIKVENPTPLQPRLL